MRKISGMLALGVLLGWAAAARAYINSETSVEWLATFRPTIVEVKVTAVGGLTEKAFGTTTFVTAHLTCDVKTVYKGKMEGPVSFDFGANKGDADVGGVGSSYLVFLDVDEQTGKTGVMNYVNLDSPGTRFRPGVAYNKAGKILRTREEIVGTLTERLKLLEKSPVLDFSKFAPTAPRSLAIEAPGEAQESLWAGSAVDLLVPPDAEFEAGFLAATQEALKLGRGPKAEIYFDAGALFPLAYYSDEKARGVFRAALEDTTRMQVRLGADADLKTPEQALTVYPLRLCAYEVLKVQGEKVELPEGYTALFGLHFQMPGGGTSVQFRAAGSGRDFYLKESKIESATQPGK